MKYVASVFVLIGCAAQPAFAQFIVGMRSVDVYGSGVRFSYSSSKLIVGGVAPFYPPPFYPPPLLVMPPPRIVVKYPLLGPGYAPADIKGVDLDLVPLKKAPPAEPPPLPKPTEPAPEKELPGVDVSRPVPPVRPEEAPVKKAPAKKPVTPADPLPDPVAEANRLTDLALNAFRDGDYGLAAQWCRKALAKSPNLSRAWFILAQADFAMGSYRDAVVAIHAGMKSDKQWPQLPVGLRSDFYKDRDADFSEQLRRLSEAVAAEPSHPTLLFLIAHQLWFDGQRKDALALFQRARPLAKDGMFIDAFLAAGGPGQVAAD